MKNIRYYILWILAIVALIFNRLLPRSELVKLFTKAHLSPNIATAIAIGCVALIFAILITVAVSIIYALYRIFRLKEPMSMAISYSIHRMLTPALLVIYLAIAVLLIFIWMAPNFSDSSPVTITTSTTQNVPADWKTYTNIQYGFEFMYPGTWANVTDLAAFSSDYLPNNRSFTAIYSSVYPAQDYNGRVDVYDEQRSTVIKNNPYLKYEIKTADTTVNGISWTSYTTPDGLDYFTELNNQTYEVSGPRGVTSQILSTFKFTK